MWHHPRNNDMLITMEEVGSHWVTI